jgi:putative endonuclease
MTAPLSTGPLLRSPRPFRAGSVAHMRAKDGVGAYGERVAERYLVERGMVMLERNWRCRFGELDLIAQDGRVLVVCEVKTRSSIAYGDPAEAVIGMKAVRLRRLAERWQAEHRGSWSELRIDVVCVLRRRQGAAEVRHLKAVA